MLLTHGARSVLRAAKVAQGAGKEIQGVRRWALDVQERSNHNKATWRWSTSWRAFATPRYLRMAARSRSVGKYFETGEVTDEVYDL